MSSATQHQYLQTPTESFERNVLTLPLPTPMCGMQCEDDLFNIERDDLFNIETK